MEPVCSLGVGELPFHASAWDPFLPVDWRARDAESVIAGEGTEWAHADDPYVAGYAAYLRSLAAGDVEPVPAAASQWSAIRTAHEIAQRDNPRRWEIQARLLAKQSDAEIAVRCSLSPDVISYYETFFFNVRPRLRAWVWVCDEVIGPGLQNGFADHEAGPLWMAFAYHGGPLVLDALLDAFHVAWRPGEPATLSVYLRPNVGITPQIQAAVAAAILPRFGPSAEAWLELRLLLWDADEAGDEDRRALLRERARAYLVGCTGAHLAGKPLPRARRRLRASEDRRATEAHGARARGTSREAELLDVVGNTVGVDPRLVEVLANRRSVPSRQAHRGTTDPGTG